jgi:hypothetical protein
MPAGAVDALFRVERDMTPEEEGRLRQREAWAEIEPDMEEELRRAEELAEGAGGGTMDARG